MKLLVIGGTGMLSGAVRELAQHAQVYSLARRPERLPWPGVVTLECDYSNAAQLEQVLSKHGPFDAALVWIHTTAPQAPAQVAKWVTGDYWQVLGSVAAEPGRVNPGQEQLANILGPRYHRIILGFVVEPLRSRWLSNSEISAGVLEALQMGRPMSIIGTVKPWELRP